MKVNADIDEPSFFFQSQIVPHRFWTQRSLDKTKPQVSQGYPFSSTLHVFKKSKNEFVPIKFTLRGSKLSYTTGKLIKYTRLENEQLTFQDSKQIAPGMFRYSITLSRGNKKKTFYSDDRIDIECWFNRLKRYCVLQRFHSDYEILDAIGQGFFSQVYKIKSKLSQNFYAVKLMEKGKLVKSQTAIDGLLSEIKCCRSLNHPTVLKLYEVYESREHIYLVFELMRGGTLLERLKQRVKLPEQKAAVLMRKLLETLKYLEKRKVIHRDIKLENILMANDNDDTNIRLADFGLSTKLRDKVKLSSKCGTPGYFAPELFKDEPYCYKVDVFSVGVVLYNLLSGHPPFAGKKREEVIESNKRCEISFSDKSWNSVSREAVDFLTKMLANNPTKRISANEALKHPWIVKHTQYEKPLASTFVEILSDVTSEEEEPGFEDAFDSPNPRHADRIPTMTISMNKILDDSYLPISFKFEEEGYKGLVCEGSQATKNDEAQDLFRKSKLPLSMPVLAAKTQANSKAMKSNRCSIEIMNSGTIPSNSNKNFLKINNLALESTISNASVQKAKSLETNSSRRELFITKKSEDFGIEVNENILGVNERIDHVMRIQQRNPSSLQTRKFSVY